MATKKIEVDLTIGEIADIMNALSSRIDFLDAKTDEYSAEGQELIRAQKMRLRVLYLKFDCIRALEGDTPE